MSQFNFLSGSSIDNSSNFLFDALASEQCYLGFSRGTPDNQWGISALVFIEHPTNAFPSNVATTGDTGTSDKFFDLNSVAKLGAGVDSKRSVKIVKYANGNFTTPLYIEDTGILSLSYVGKNWMLIQGLNKDYYNFLKPSLTESYYIENWHSGSSSVRVKILNKSFVNIPYYTSNCELYMKETPSSSLVKIQTGIQKSSNSLGETFITGLTAPESIPASGMNYIFNDTVADAATHKNTLKNATFTLTDNVGNVILDNLTFVDPESGTANLYTEVANYEQTQKYLTFKYLYVDGKYQYLKFIVGTNEVDALAIWQESLPFESVIPVADANPPALEISYLKNPTISNSIFDVNGLTKIKSSEIKYVKELANTAASAQAVADGFDVETILLTGENVNHVGIVRSATVSGGFVIPMQDFHTFVVGDTIFIPYKPQTTTAPGKTYTIAQVDYTNASASITFSEVLRIDETLNKDVVLNSNPTNVTASIMLAWTTDKDKALSYGFYNVIVEKDVPITNASSTACPTENIYRQLFICYKPKYSTGSICSEDIYNTDANYVASKQIFNSTTWKYDIGMLLYLSNKIPVYRKWATASEQFKIIL